MNKLIFYTLVAIMTFNFALSGAINVITGEYCEQQNVLKCGTLTLQHNYNCSEGSCVGSGWHFNHPNVAFGTRRSMPTGEQYSYHYDEEHRLRRVEALGTKAQQFSLTYGDLEGDKSCTIATPDGKSVTYNYRLFPGATLASSNIIIEKITTPDGQSCSYEYSPHPHDRRCLLTCRKGAEGRTLLNEYYLSPAVEDPLTDSDDPYRQLETGRIKRQFAPIGHDNALLQAYAFEYKPSVTTMRDAYGHKSVYHYSDHGRLTAIKSYVGQSADEELLYRTERFYWDFQESSTAPLLLSQTLEDASGAIVNCTTFAHDENGNLIEKTIWGDLSGDGAPSFTVDEKGHPYPDEALEKYSIKYQYSAENPSILLKVSEDNGIVVEQHYEQNCPKPTAIFTSLAGKLLKRQFIQYDSSGMAIQVIEDDGFSCDSTSLEGVSERRITLTTYGSEAQLSSLPISIEQYTVGCAKERCRELMSQTIYSYTPSGEIESEEHYNGDGGLTESIYYSYDQMGRITALIDHKGNCSSFSYDANGNKVMEKYCDGSGNQSATNHRYDFADRLIATEKSDERNVHTTTLRYYDLVGNLIATRDRCGNETRYQYDSLGRRTAAYYPEVFDGDDNSYTPQQYWEYDLCNRIIATIDANGDKVSIRYNVRGKPTEIIYGDSSVESFRYNLDGTLKSAKAKNGTVIHYNSNGRNAPPAVTFVDSGGGVVKAEISKCGNNSSNELSGNHSSFDREEILDSVDSEKFAEECVLNELGQKVLQRKWRDSAGNITIYTYDALRRIATIEKCDSLGQPATLCKLRYDGVGNKVREEHTTPQGDRSYTTIWRYGPNAKLTAIIEGANSEQQRITEYLYNDYGQLATVIKPDGIALSHHYTALGQLSELYASDRSLHLLYRYDDKGRYVELLDLIDGSSTFRSYSPEGRLAAETLGNGLTVNYGYDDAGYRNKLQLPDGSAIAYRYEGAQLMEIFRLSSCGEKLYSHTYERGTNSMINSAALPGSLGKLQIARDDRGRIRKIETPFWSTELDDESFDIAGNTIKVVTREGANCYDCSYRYDLRGQLIGESGNSNCSYQYDYIENRLNSNQKKYEYEGELYLTDSSSDLWRYDANGNSVMSENRAGEVTKYSYDALNRLTGVTLEGEWRVQYGYDPLHRRIWQSTFIWDSAQGKWQNVKKIRFLYDGNDEIGSCDEAGKLAELRLLGQGIAADIGAMVAIELKGKAYVAISDHRGSLSCLVSIDEGRASEYYRYSAFGDVDIINDKGDHLERSALGNPWQFFSKRRDDFTHLLYFGKRYYKPDIGRWLTPDPLKGVDGPNPYVFVHNNPLSNIDLYGLWTVREGWEELTTFCKKIWSKIDTFFQKVRNVCSLAPLMEESIDAFAEQVVGPSLLLMLGYYPAHPEVGHYGHGEINSRVRITFVNGILNIKEDFTESLKMLSNAHGGVNIHYIFRPTGGWYSDIVNALLVKCGLASLQAYQLAASWRSLIEEMGGPEGGGMILHYAHSIGSGDTWSARKMLTVEEQRMIKVMTFGSPMALPSEGFRDVVNYASIRDGVPWCDPIAHLNALCQGDSNIQYVGDHRGFPFIDHLFDSPSYYAVIEALGEQFIDLYGSVAQPKMAASLP